MLQEGAADGGGSQWDASFDDDFDVHGDGDEAAAGVFTGAPGSSLGLLLAADIAGERTAG